MIKPDRERLTALLRTQVAAIAADLRAQLLAAGPARVRAQKLHAEEKVAEDFEVWTDLLSRRAAVLWVLKTVYVRVLEDKGLLTPGRLFDPEAWQLFERLAPNLGESAFLRWIFRDLASPRGGLPELFGVQPAEVVEPSDERSRALIALWRREDPDTGHHWSFATERFDGELMGDLYQDLDPTVKDRFALCQTPEFVRRFILDRTLAPAIETFGADTVRLLDHACGSGHFLIDGLKRLVAATAAQHPDWSTVEVVRHALDRVVGIDLNDYACALARARLIMTAADLCGVTDLRAAAAFHPHVYWADGLEQVERGEGPQPRQLSLLDPAQNLAPRACLSRPEVREALGRVLAPRFHAVVANPPYIVETDEAKKEYHREKSGKTRRYLSAYRQYSLGSPFTERCFQLAVKAGFVGLITGNNFMKREFGKPLIEAVLANVDLSLVVDTSQAYIPFHGTPTVLLFARNRAPVGETVRAVMGKRGETGTPADPAQGRVWSSIEQGWASVGFENEFVSVADVERATFARHPWSLGGGGAAELKTTLDHRAQARLGEVVKEVGFVCMTRADDIYFTPFAALKRAQIADENIIANIEGDRVRDWAVFDPNVTLFPYDSELAPVSFQEAPEVHRFLWPYRSLLWLRREPNGNHLELGLTWWEWSRFQRERYRTPLSIAFAFVATHNHFVLDRGGKVFNRSAPVIKLPAGATEDDHYALLGLLNSSTACFWMKQVFHNKGGGTDSGKWQSDPAKVAYEFTATGLLSFPIPPLTEHRRARIVALARCLDALAARRERCLAESLPGGGELPAPSIHGLQRLLADAEADEKTLLRRMILLQEELDWVVYEAYGLTAGEHLLNLGELDEDPGVQIGARPFEILQAQGGRECGVDGQPLEKNAPSGLPGPTQRVWEARIAAIEGSPALQLIEHEAYKRRWLTTPKYLAGRVETFSDRARSRITLLMADLAENLVRESAVPLTAPRITAELQADRRFMALAEYHTGRRDFDAGLLVYELLDQDAIPSHPFHVYSEAGQLKYSAWDQTWDAQRREDAGEAVAPPIPPKYGQGDYLRPESWKLRGKLDVPKERFIAFTEVPGRDGDDTLYGWAGWTPVQRVRVLLALDEGLEDDGVSLADRVGLLDSAWRLLPDAEREDPAVASRLRAELRAILGGDGFSPEQRADWKARFPPPRARRARR